ncbi:TonB family protein [Pseudoduganella aquatica]|uniref:TonB family protein n=1 Tax=Pseudoduganella aquatica TaxID=2660641 RepID=A0A7X4KM68_9BURK|nr:TonB family protein [Pseudoduganella aquatica]MYN07872.1 TonB family protein [Pseudoduganella aquatica]
MLPKNQTYQSLISGFLMISALTPTALYAHPSTAVASERIEVASSEELSRCDKPIWPHQRSNGNLRGEVTLAFLVSDEGKVIDTFVRKSSKYESLDRAASFGIRRCQFKPRLVNGFPIARWIQVKYNFIMPGGYSDPTEKMLRNQRKAVDGDLDAYFQLALDIRSELADDTQAIPMFRDAAERGHAGAIYQLADAMWHGRGLPMNQPKALSYFMSAAQLGHADSEYEVGMAYVNGVGVMPSIAKAIPWLRKAADQGNHEAQVALGDALAAQTEPQPDYQAIAGWYQQAAQAGDDLGQLRLAQCYLLGSGVEKNPAQAAFWLRKAADQRQPRAEALLASLYLEGTGVAVDKTEADKLLRLSAAGGDPVAMRRLAAIAPTPDEAKAWLQKALQADPSANTQSLTH